MYNLKKVTLIQIKKDTNPKGYKPGYIPLFQIPQPNNTNTYKDLFDSASGHQFQKRHQLKASFFMSNLLSYFISQRLKIVKLPIKCKIKFIPRQRYNPNTPLPKKY